MCAAMGDLPSEVMCRIFRHLSVTEKAEVRPVRTWREPRAQIQSGLNMCRG